MHYQIWCVLYQKTIIYTKFFFFIPKNQIWCVLYQKTIIYTKFFLKKTKFGVFCTKNILSVPIFFLISNFVCSVPKMYHLYQFRVFCIKNLLCVSIFFKNIE